jgi:hypothetical protein
MTNVVKPNDLKRAGDFTVDDCRLTLSSGVELDISGVLLEVQLYEDIDTPSVTGTVSFVNTDGLSNRGPIIGQEYLKLKIRTPTFTKEENIIDFTENVLHVTNVTVSQVGNKGELILMNVITSEAVRNQGAVVSRSVKGTYDQFVRALLENDLKCTKNLDIERTEGVRKYVLPNNTNPFDLIKIFRRKAVSADTNSPTYVFFENFRGYHFKTLEKMYGQEPVMTYLESSFGADIGDKDQENPKKRLERELSTIQAASIINRKDTLVNMSLGALSSELTTFDVVTKQFNGGNGPETPFVYNYFDDRKNEKHINDFDKESTGDNPIYSEVTSENKRISDSNHVDFLSFTATIPNGGGSGQTITGTPTPAQRRENRSNPSADEGYLGPEAGSSTGENGKLSTTNLLPIGRNHFLRADAGRAYLAMVAAAAKDNIKWSITSSYRPFNVQVRLAREKGLYGVSASNGTYPDGNKVGLAARPGTSKHGWGLAVDLGGGANRKGTPENNWLVNNAGRFGFKTIPQEAWHWQYEGGVNIPTTEPLVADQTQTQNILPGANNEEEFVVQQTSAQRDALHEGDGSYEPVKTDEWLQRRRSFMVNLHSGIGLNLRVNGNTKVSAGDIVIVNLRSPLIDKGEKADPKDRYFRGNFLVTKIEHTFKLANSKHEMQMTVMKDSMESPLPSGVNEEPRSVQQGNPEQTTNDSRTPAERRVGRTGTVVAGTAFPSQKEMIEHFENDPEFQAAWERLKRDRPQVDKAEFYRVIYGESRGDHTIRNKTSGTVGLFQFTRGTAKGLGTSVEEIGRMTPAQQVDVYNKYLRSYKGGGVGSLSVYGAAPSFAHRSDDTVVYKVGSKAWRINKAYRPADNGPITVGSLKRYLTSKKYSA